MLRSNPFSDVARALIDSIEDLFEASGFNVETPEDFAAIPDDEWDAFIASVTDFPDWRGMQEAAPGEWVKRGLGL